MPLKMPLQMQILQEKFSLKLNPVKTLDELNHFFGNDFVFDSIFVKQKLKSGHNKYFRANMIFIVRCLADNEVETNIALLKLNNYLRGCGIQIAKLNKDGFERTGVRTSKFGNPDDFKNRNSKDLQFNKLIESLKGIKMQMLYFQMTLFYKICIIYIHLNMNQVQR